ncbi:ShlB/FhaC/HecB family hemolysin secretion/activation protein [Paludibacterium paludis]|uniref:POTRA domain-containing protein n=1 Tax=Paludibacterium paludis TaxID=1225769 RepID=A0A918P5P9_9NEIS|nr:ShlB/FhaC/HecB family hemolysin secretion/activation protein [Paludibacterium paludis]GGY22196.1 hypothetical protein GCM10011289_27310 [Paludibacterium paludis]
MEKYPLILPGALRSLLLLSGAVYAGTPPDAGSVLQGLSEPPAPPVEKPALKLTPPPAHSVVVPGGPEVMLRSVTFSGNTAFDAATLAATLGTVSGKFDHAGMRALAERVEQFYRERGYAFTRVYLPPQTLADGVLRIEVLEGRYGKIQAIGAPGLVSGSQPFMNALRSGELIENTQLERAMMILGDQAGIVSVPFISPGANAGEGDLSVRLSRSARLEGDVGLDNSGNRYTGEYRLRGDLDINSPLFFGDKLSLGGMKTDKRMWMGSVTYELPLGGGGLRGQVGYARTNYQLGADYASLKATGFAKVTTARLSYPFIRSQASNLILFGSFQHKALEDHYGATDTINDKSSDSWPFGVQFDHRDRFGGAGLSYGSLVWTRGRLRLNAALSATDAMTARTQGHFSKWNLDVVRLQQLPGPLMLFGRFSGQWTNKNLDSSERMGIGGADAVRAYPLGEGLGDRGWLVQSELRYIRGMFAPFVFYDAARTEENAKPWDGGSSVSRSLAGFGLGLRIDGKSWRSQTAVAWKSKGGKALADGVTRDPRVWVSLQYRF